MHYPLPPRKPLHISSIYLPPALVMASKYPSKNPLSAGEIGDLLPNLCSPFPIPFPFALPFPSAAKLPTRDLGAMPKEPDRDMRSGLLSFLGASNVDELANVGEGEAMTGVAAEAAEAEGDFPNSERSVCRCSGAWELRRSRNGWCGGESGAGGGRREADSGLAACTVAIAVVDAGIAAVTGAASGGLTTDTGALGAEDGC